MIDENRGRTEGDRRSGRLAAFTLPVVMLIALQFLSTAITAPAITFFPVYLDGLGYSALFISLISVIQRVLGLAAAVTGGALCDRLSRKQVIVLGQIGFFAGSLLFLTSSAWLAALLWGLSGFGMMLFSIGSQSYLIDHADPRSLGFVTALYYWGFTLGGSLSNLAAGYLLGRSGYSGMVLGMMICAGATIALSIVLLPRGGAAPPAAQEQPLAGFFGYGEIARRPAVLLLGALRFLPTFLYGILLVFIPLLLKEAGASSGSIALYAAASSIGAALCQLVLGRLADTRGPRGPTLLAFALLAAGAAGLAAFPGSYWPVFVCGTVSVAAAWALSTILPILVARISAAADRGRILGFIQLFWSAGMIAGTLIGGLLYEAGRGLPFAAGAALNALSLALTFVFFRLPARR